jgi:hypothetical protein
VLLLAVRSKVHMCIVQLCSLSSLQCLYLLLGVLQLHK